jgi:hypothetical protein
VRGFKAKTQQRALQMQILAFEGSQHAE